MPRLLIFPALLLLLSLAGFARAAEDTPPADIAKYYDWCLLPKYLPNAIARTEGFWKKYHSQDETYPDAAHLRQEPVEKLEGAAREAQGMDGKASATRSPAAGCKEPTTPPAALESHARRVALILAWDGVARRSKITADILPPRALSQAKINSNATPSSFSTGSYVRRSAYRLTELYVADGQKEKCRDMLRWLEAHDNTLPRR